MKIDISSDAAIAILLFLREFVKKDRVYADELTHLRQCIDEYENEVVRNISMDELDDVFENLEIKALIGHSPPLRG